MSEQRIWTCDCCGAEGHEDPTGRIVGFMDWIKVLGVKLNDAVDPVFCPSCRDPIMEFIDSLAEEHRDAGAKITFVSGEGLH